MPSGHSDLVPVEAEVVLGALLGVWARHQAQVPQAGHPAPGPAGAGPLHPHAQERRVEIPEHDLLHLRDRRPQPHNGIPPHLHQHPPRYRHRHPPHSAGTGTGNPPPIPGPAGAHTALAQPRTGIPYCTGTGTDCIGKGGTPASTRYRHRPRHPFCPGTAPGFSPHRPRHPRHPRHPHPARPGPTPHPAPTAPAPARPLSSLGTTPAQPPRAPPPASPVTPRDHAGTPLPPVPRRARPHSRRRRRRGGSGGR